MPPRKTPAAEADDFDPKGRRGKVKREIENIPVKYQPLLDWYGQKFMAKRNGSKETDPILGLLGLGKEIWVGKDPDDMSTLFVGMRVSRIFGIRIYHLSAWGFQGAVGTGHQLG
jgi:hypothetical protein